MLVSPEQLHKFVFDNQTFKLKKSLEDNLTANETINLNHRYESGTSLLILAAYLNHIEILNILFSYPLTYPVDVNQADDYGDTALFLACDLGHFYSVKKLYEKRDDEIDINHANKLGNTPLHIAAYNGHLEIVKYLLERGAAVNFRNKEGKTASDLARLKNRYHILNALQANSKAPSSIILPPVAIPVAKISSSLTTATPVASTTSTLGSDSPAVTSAPKVTPNNAAYAIQKAYIKYKNRKKLKESSLTFDSAYQKLENGELFQLDGRKIGQLSNDNLAYLKRDVFNFGGACNVHELAILDYITTKAKFFLTHGTKSREIAQKSGFLKSNVILSNEIAGFRANTFEIDKKFIANDDFIFFTLDLKPKHNKQYGPEIFYIDCDDVEFFKNGWLSYIDFLEPKAFNRKIFSSEIKAATYGIVREPYTPNWHHERVYGHAIYLTYGFFYYNTKRTRVLRILDLISYAGDMKQAIAYNIILELRLMGLSIPFSSFSNDMKLEFCHNLLNNLFYLEAKIPKKVYVKFMRPDSFSQYSLNKWKKQKFEDSV